jgi:CheY-like chemotaxis protein
MRAPITILMADDDADDREMAGDAFHESRLQNELRFVEDGQQLMDYLRREGAYRDVASSPRPGLILLDLNMPKMDGREALRALKNDAELRRIPVVILTTSKTEEDIYRSYDLGANSFITKPVTFDALVDILGNIGKYWLQVVALPEDEVSDDA